jgi:hypothetical protein
MQVGIDESGTGFRPAKQNPCSFWDHSQTNRTRREASMTNSIRWLRVSYWWGIIADGLMAVLMLLPARFAALMNVDIASMRDFGYGMGLGAPLMVGWTVLLFWADREPLARKDILPLTLVVVAGYIAFEVYSIGTGYASLAVTIPVLGMQTAMSAMFIFSYLNARQMEARTVGANRVNEAGKWIDDDLNQNLCTVLVTVPDPHNEVLRMPSSYASPPGIWQQCRIDVEICRLASKEPLFIERNNFFDGHVGD